MKRFVIALALAASMFGLSTLRPKEAASQIGYSGGGASVASDLTVGTADFTLQGDNLFVGFGTDDDAQLEYISSSDSFFIGNSSLTDNTLGIRLTSLAASSESVVELFLTPGIGDGSDVYKMFNIDIANTNHTGASNEVHAISIDSITADAQAEEYAISFGTGWENGLLRMSSFASGQRLFSFTSAGGVALVPYYNTSTSEQLFIIRDVITSGGVRFQWNSNFGAGQSGTVMEVLTAGAAMNGSDTQIGLQLDMASGNHTGTGNILTALDIDALTGDANSNLYAINIGALTGTVGAAGEAETAINIATGWDNGIAIASQTTELYFTDTTPVIRTGANGTGTFTDLNGVIAFEWSHASTGPGILIKSPQYGTVSSTNFAITPALSNAMDGSDTITSFQINAVAVNHTGTGNTQNLIDIAAIAGDANSNLNAINIGALTGTAGAAGETENVIKVGAGWDNTIVVAEGSWSMGNGGTFDIRSGSTNMVRFSHGAVPFMTMVDPDLANNSEMLTMTATTVQVMDGSDSEAFIEFAGFTDANHTSTGNDFFGLHVLTITSPDADATHSVIGAQGGYDYFIHNDAALGTDAWTTASDKSANTASGTIKVEINGTLYHIQLYADS